MKKIVRRGFTLPEILVTVTVVAVLAAVVVPAVTQYVNKGNTPASQQDVQQLQIAVTAFTADTRHYPGDLRQLTTLINTTTTFLKSDGAASPVLYTGNDTAKWKGPYIATVLNGSGLFTSQGLNFTVGATLTDSANWLQVPITTPGASSGATCPSLLALDKALDGVVTAGLEGTTGTIIWGGTCTNALTTGTVTGPWLRIVPAS